MPLPALEEMDHFFHDNGRLPGIPVEGKVKEKRINLGGMKTKLLQKIEELTLYVIKMKKENNSQAAGIVRTGE